MAPDLTPEERVRRVKAALAEAGYPDADVTVGPFGGPSIGGVIPDAVAWRAWAIADPEGLECWPCWSIGADYPDDVDPGELPESDCTHDPLTSPWPEVVRG